MAKRTKNAALTDAEEHKAHELRLYLDNEADLYRQYRTPVDKALTRRMAAGTFELEKAPKAYKPLVDAAAKKYAREFAKPSDWNTIFSKRVRDFVADDLANDFVWAYKAGDFDEYIPKKYQKTMKNPKQRKRNVFSHSFSPEFYFAEGEPYDVDVKKTKRPISVWHVYDSSENPYQGDAVQLAKYRKAREKWEGGGRRGPPPVHPARRAAKGSRQNPPKKTLEVGDLVKHTAKFLRSTGQYKSKRVDGVVVGHGYGDNVFVSWSDNPFPIQINSANLEKKKTTRSRKDLLLAARHAMDIAIGVTHTPAIHVVYFRPGPEYSFWNAPAEGWNQEEFPGDQAGANDASRLATHVYDDLYGDAVVVGPNGYITQSLTNYGQVPEHAKNPRAGNLARRLSNP